MCCVQEFEILNFEFSDLYAWIWKSNYKFENLNAQKCDYILFTEQKNQQAINNNNECLLGKRKEKQPPSSTVVSWLI